MTSISKPKPWRALVDYEWRLAKRSGQKAAMPIVLPPHRTLMVDHSEQSEQEAPTSIDLTPYEILRVNLSNVETKGFCVCFPPVVLLCLLEKVPLASSRAVLRDRSNHWMSTFPSRWALAGGPYCDDGYTKALELVEDWWRHVRGRDLPNPVSIENGYHMFRLLPHAAKGEYIDIKYLALFPLLGNPEHAACLVRGLGGEEGVAKIRKELDRLRRKTGRTQIEETLCIYCAEIFGRRVQRRSVPVCPKKACQDLRGAEKKRVQYCRDFG